MIYKVIPIDDYGVVVDENTKPKYMDWYGLTDNRNVVNGVDRMDSSTSWVYSDSPKILFSIGKRLDGVTLIELADDIEILAAKFSENRLGYSKDEEGSLYEGFIAGYKANTNKYSEEDMRNCFEKGLRSDYDSDFNTYLQSLQKQPIPTEVELETEEKTSEQIQKELGIYGHDEGLTEKEYQDYIKHNSVVKIHNKETDTITALNAYYE